MPTAIPYNPDYTKYNPFLTNVPLVTIVKLVRVVNGVEVETPELDCVRVFHRAVPNSSVGKQTTEIVAAPVNNRIIPDPLGRNNYMKYFNRDG
mgnify:CR=1 FL=1